ncbi:MAG: cell division protein FtsQ/DivIB [Pseudomonadota bacterium]
MRNIRINKIKAFIISRPAIRFARLFFYNQIFPYFKYSFYFFVVLAAMILIYLAIFKKSQLEQIKERTIRYSYKIINFGHSYNKIKISGNEKTSYEQIAKLARAHLAADDDINNQEMIESLKSEIEKLPWVDEVVISVSLQDSLNIHIKEHQPFAIWEDSQKYIVSKTGKIIAVDNLEDFGSLIILTGNNAYKNVKSLFNILAIDPEVSKNIYSATWVGGRRWDVRFENGLLVKLPSSNSDNDMSYAWDSLIKIYNMPGALLGLKAVDLRIAKKIYLEYDDRTTKELKSFSN